MHPKIKAIGRHLVFLSLKLGRQTAVIVIRCEVP